MIKGWKTAAGCIGLAILAIVDVANGDITGAVTKASGAFSIYGLGHKTEKAAAAAAAAAAAPTVKE